MKEFCYPTTKSTTAAKIKQFFSHFLFVCSFFLFFFPYLLMENLRSRFEASEDEQTPELECSEDFHDAPCKWQENPDVEDLTKSQQHITSKEKEWRRTLACKLYQERHSVGEGMDMLWEVYEKTEEENRGKQRQVSEVKINTKTRIVDYLEEEDEEEEEEAEDSNLCCLKALRFSAGKMHFGFRMAKALKGVKPGWFNHHYRHQNRQKKV